MKLKLIFLMVMTLSLASCGNGEKSKTEVPAAANQEEKVEVASADPMSNKGIGPISNVTLGEIDQVLVTEGEKVFKAKCTACHKISKKFVGPALKGVTERRSSEWIMNMVLNPEEMIQKDPIAIKLLAEANGAPMANQNITEEEARAILEYFRTKN